MRPHNSKGTATLLFITFVLALISLVEFLLLTCALIAYRDAARSKKRVTEFDKELMRLYKSLSEN
jgi:hypothetical protein